MAVTFSSHHEGGITTSCQHILCTSQSGSHPESDGQVSEGISYDDTNFGYMDGHEDTIDDLDALVTSKQKCTVADNPLLVWLSNHNEYLAEMLRMDGRGDFTSDTCCKCTSAPTLFHCNDCRNMQLYCRDCTVCNHLQSPTHCIKKWTGSFFMATSLKKLSLRIQLGHMIGKTCILPCKSFNDNFLLINTNGIHKIAIDFCACETSQTHTKQLLHLGWFPSTTVDPRTASKASAYEFYHSLVCIMDNVGLIKKDRYESFMCMVHDMLYSLFVAINTNFQLKRQDVSSDEADPSLSKGWSYFVEEKFKSHLKEHLSETQEKSSCSNHNAMNMAETKLLQGLAATGVGTVDCMQHNFKRPNGVGDPQKREKYINMDYLFFSTLCNNCHNVLNMLYDSSRMESLPESHHLSYLHIFIWFFIPKFHLPAHIKKCQTMFSFNFMCFMGHMDGEAPKHGWSNINLVASSTKAMGPGCHRDTLDNHFGDWNWKKVIGLGAHLIHKMQEAVIEKDDHEAAFQEFNTVISSNHRSAWTAKMEKWKENPNDASVTNPLESNIYYLEIMQAAVHLKLAEMEAEELACRIDLSLHPNISQSVLITSGLDLEEEQCCVRAVSEAMGLHVSDIQKGTLTQMRNVLHCKIETWRTYEWDLWYAQAHNALEELQQCLCVHCSMLTFKQEWVHGQGSNTCAQNALAHVHAQQVACMKRYRVAWGVLKTLAPLLKKDEDVKPLVDPFSTKTEGHCCLTWIWMMMGIHVEWCKSRARALYWAEEVELLQEEMRRVLQFFDWQANWWDKQQDQIICETVAQCKGLVAYTHKQGHIQWQLASHFRAL
ncbi:uncharacterized protein BJ212DRAFT_1448064 [Suillus subaureus]|uniref:CxC2-like cysteine cluster KDZ transposase-associated domain-containing protein n=1 Tax=Suillus subaureus TaxID=48587 RepID=A0A9P7E6Q4_9AGAM|nr:uncharacterized protein BJ212DRAFT_1448064 [Suillus subaureus]KAG1812886.1 hypothetical protein BJ212DRAFT_1448064 [Suillus subaureus]